MLPSGSASAKVICPGSTFGAGFGSGSAGGTLAPTIADLAGASLPEPSDGQSFASLLRRRVAPTGWQNEILLHGYDNGDTDGDQQGHPPTFWGLRTQLYKYIETSETGEVELYDLTADPYELDNVAENPSYSDIRAELRARLLALVRTGTTTAGTVWVDGARNLQFAAGSEVGDHVTVTASGTSWVVTDVSAPVIAGAGCEQLGVNRVACPQSAVSRLVLTSGDRPDTITTPAGMGATVEGGSEADVLTTGNESDVLRGGGGDDLLDGGTGADTVTYAQRSVLQPVSAHLDGVLGNDRSIEDGPADTRDSILLRRGEHHWYGWCGFHRGRRGSERAGRRRRLR